MSATTRGFRAKVEGGGEREVGYHEFVQWCCDTQLTALAAEAMRRSRPVAVPRLPGRVSTARASTSRSPAAAACSCRDASVGAPAARLLRRRVRTGDVPPPGSGLTRGPAMVRAPARACLDAASSGSLRDVRIDHVMGLHRLWFIPHGRRARVGGARTCATRAMASSGLVLGARGDGTAARSSARTSEPFRRRRTARSAGPRRARHVGLAVRDAVRRRPRPAPTASRSSRLDTHDLPPFAAWWARDCAAQRNTVIDTLRGERHARTRATSPTPPRHSARSIAGSACPRRRSSSPRSEDLWLETEPQNRPGTPSDENFRHRGTYGFDDLDDLDDIGDHAGRDGLVDPTRLLRLLDDARGRGAAGSAPSPEVKT